MQKILIEEGEYSDVNYYFMQTALKYKNTYLTNKNGDLFLTVGSLITLKNIITGSRHIGLRDMDAKPAGYSKIYMDKSLVQVSFFEMETAEYAKSYLLIKQIIYEQL